ncbi:hypothetical protein ABE488_15570 [Luteimonas sp. TWI662]|uniref:hypothetical protein n=1 Tax=Luteimonas sp. TWI662 TaxID=3136789 RepID=UPI003208BD3F
MNAVDSNAQRLLIAWYAAQDGKLHVPPHMAEHLEELRAAELTASGLVNEGSLSETTRLLALSAGGAMILGNQQRREAEDAARGGQISIPEVQAQLFAHFAALFEALTGTQVQAVRDEDEIRARMLRRAQQDYDALMRTANSAIDAIVNFYNNYATLMFGYAKSLGGMRLVLGGQRQFGPSALGGVRLSALYADTQLIPDPIYPFFSGDLRLSALHLQLAISLYHLLQIRPLIDARLPVAPVFVFPSFEQELSERDAHTAQGQADLALRLLAPICDGSIASLEELFDYAQRQEDAFGLALMRSGLFVPPGGDPAEKILPNEAAARYLGELRGRREAAMIERMEQLPLGVLLLQGTLERITPYYHLLDNAGELGAQPLLTQAVHWHYFEKISEANAKVLRARSVISDRAAQTLRSIQDTSLTWLTEIPVSTLVSLIADDQHRWLRHELDGFTARLATLDSSNASEMVKEINFGLSSLVQRQQKLMRDIEKKYAPQRATLLLKGAAGAGLAATAAFLPSLSPFLGLAVPASAAAGAVGGIMLGYGQAKLGAAVEKRQAARSILGVLAAVRPK